MPPHDTQVCLVESHNRPKLEQRLPAQQILFRAPQTGAVGVSSQPAKASITTNPLKARNVGTASILPKNRAAVTFLSLLRPLWSW